MDDDVPDNTAVEIDNLLDDPKALSQQLPQSTEEDQSLEEILAQSSTDLLRTFAASINQNVLREASEAEEFRQELKRRLLRAVFRTYVWSTARLSHEIESANGRLEGDMRDLLSAEREQGRSSPPPPTILGSSIPVSVCAGTTASANLVRQDRLRARLSELMAAVSRAAEMFTQF